VNVLLLYLLLLKATMLSFSGLASLPIIRHDLVLKHRVLTDRQLNTAVAIGRAGPGPLGLYIVSVGYYVDGIPGAFVAFLAMVTPAFLVIPILVYLGSRAERPRVRGAIRAVTLASAGLIAASTVPLSRDAVAGGVPIAIAVGSFVVLVRTRHDTVWVLAASGLAGILARIAT